MILAGISIGAIAGYLGTLIFSKRMALAAGPLGHLTLPGIALALIYGFNLSLAAFPFVLLGAILIWLLEAKTKLPMEALTAVVFSSGVAISFLFLPIEQAEVALVGDITKITPIESLISLIVSLLLFLIIRRSYSKITLVNISEDLAKAEGIDVRKYNLIYLLSLAVVVSLGVKLVGGLLTAALVAIPVAASRNLSRNLFQYTFLATLFGALSVLIGIILFNITGFSAGPLIIVVSSFIFLLSILK